jgi:hypothetical protein
MIGDLIYGLELDNAISYAPRCQTSFPLILDVQFAFLSIWTRDLSWYDIIPLISIQISLIPVPTSPTLTDSELHFKRFLTRRHETLTRCEK